MVTTQDNGLIILRSRIRLSFTGLKRDGDDAPGQFTAPFDTARRARPQQIPMLRVPAATRHYPVARLKRTPGIRAPAPTPLPHAPERPRCLAVVRLRPRT